MKQSLFKLFVGMTLSMFIVACSSLEDARKIDYQSVKTNPDLQVPPDLTKAPETNVSPGASTTTYSEFAGGKKEKTEPVTTTDKVAVTTTAPAPAAKTGPSVLPQVPGILLDRDGQNHWLTVSAAPDALWPYLRSFVLDAGMKIEFENPVTGIIETGWLDNRSTTEGKSTTFSTLLSRPAVNGLRDKFRLRVERGKQPGTTYVYLIDQGMVDAAAPASGKSNNPRWQLRPADPDLEIEMLQLLTAYIGPDGPTKGATVAAAPVATPAVGGTAVASAAAQTPAVKAPLRKDGWEYVLDLTDAPDVAWQRVGESLERANFMITDRDKNKKMYDVKYTDEVIDEMSRTFMQDMFSMETKKTPPVPYEVRVKQGKEGTVVLVKAETGASLPEDLGRHLLTVIYTHLN